MSRRKGVEAPLVGAVTVVNRSIGSHRNLANGEEWQSELWRLYDSVGEFRSAAGWIANALSRVRLFAAKPPETLGDEPVAMEGGRAVELMRAFCGGPGGQSQATAELARLLTVDGVGWLTAITNRGEDGTETVTWNVHSNDEVRATAGSFQVQVDEATWVKMPEGDEPTPVPGSTLDLLVKVWRTHPRRGWEADSPARANLSALTEIELLTAHIHATATSRLAGAGVWIVPSEATFYIPGQTQSAAATNPGALADLMMEAMVIPIKDRGSASAVVPLMVTIPGAFANGFQRLTNDTAFDDRVMELREAAVKRFAVGMDMPPETLTGLGDTNHWQAWAIQDEAITIHVDPLAELMCHAFTIGYLWPALEAENLPPDAICWYTTDDLRVPADRSENAVAAYDRIEISGAALRRETGFAEEDAPEPAERATRLLEKLVLAAPALAPGLAAQLGLDVPPLPTEPGGGTPTTPTLPEPEPIEVTEAPPDRPITAANGAGTALLLTSDLLVGRALERAGARLRSKWKGPRTDRPVAEMHVAIHEAGEDVTRIESCDSLLAGAWTAVDGVAALLEVAPDALRHALNAYTRSLIASGHAHDRDRLAAALGLAGAH